MDTLTIDVHGLDCPSEVKIIRDALRPLLDDEQIRFDLLNAHVFLALKKDDPEPDRFVQAINNAGLKATICSGHDSKVNTTLTTGERIEQLVFVSSGLLLLLAFVLQLILLGPSPRALLTFWTTSEHPLPVSAMLIAAAFLGMSLALPKAWSALRNFRADMHLLMSIAVVGALILGEFTEGAMVAFLFAVSLRLEQWSVAKARNSIQTLLDIAPQDALLVEDGKTRKVPVATIAPGAIVRVLPGDRVSVDGEIVLGETAFDESPVTGESMPKEKGVGALVFAGSINRTASVDFRATRPASDSTVARIIRLVQEAQGRKANVERWADQFARYYTPIMLLLALLVATLPPLILGVAWSESIYRALVLLLIACPCALVISTPVTIVAGLTAAARQGVLIKGGVYLEAVAGLKAIAFDKTGTLTEGAPKLCEIVVLDEHTQDELLALAAAVESQSNHPLAKAIVKHAQALGLTLPAVEKTGTVPGMGATGYIDGTPYWLGNLRMLKARGRDAQALDLLGTHGDTPGQSLVILGNDTQVCGAFRFSDQIRNEGLQVIQELATPGTLHLEMLTGDNEATAAAIAQSAGLRHWRSELLPEDKATAIIELERQIGPTAMVGDGINDAPALANATVGIAMGVAGTDAALESADIALMEDSLAQIPWLIRHAQRTLGIVQQNVLLALGLKMLVLILAAAGLTTLWLAIAADMGASLLVTFNGLRLLHRSR